MEWIWRERLKGEEEGVDTMQGINKVLLENLLPAHVARHFLTNIKVFFNLYCQGQGRKTRSRKENIFIFNLAC